MAVIAQRQDQTERGDSAEEPDPPLVNSHEREQGQCDDTHAEVVGRSPILAVLKENALTILVGVKQGHQ
jgi:hypothetical protein